MNGTDRLVPFVAASFLLHLGATFWYVFAFRIAPHPVPIKSTLYNVNLVEMTRPKVEPEVLPEPVPEVEKREPEEARKIPETIRPREEKKKEIEPEVSKPDIPAKKKLEQQTPPPARTSKPTVEAPQLTASSPISVEVENFEFSYYLALIENRVGGKWNPPKGLVVTRPSVTVRFEILRNGHIAGPQITHSSGQAFFDLSAMRAVQDADPFPPLPDGFDGDRLAVNFIFHYEG